MGRKEAFTSHITAKAIAVLITFIIAGSALMIRSENADGLDETVVEGWVFDQDIMPMANISISLVSGGIVRNAKTNSEGYFKIRYVSPYNNYTVKAYSDWTTNSTEDLTLNWGTTNQIDLYVTELNLCGLEGYVRMLADGRGAYNAAVHFHKTGYPSQVTFAEVDGYFKFESVPSGYCDLIFELGGYETIERTRQYLDRGEWNYINVQMWPIEFDLTVEPEDGSIDVEVTEVIIIHFTLPLDPGSVDGSNFYVKDAVTERILDSSLFLSENGTELVMAHNEYFDHETLYTITISEEVENIYNSKLGYEVKINFTTKVQPIGFQVDSIEPGTDASEVPVTTSIRVTFPFSINGSTLNNETVKVIMAGSLNPIETTKVYYTDNRTLLIDPNNDLHPATSYRVILSTDIQALMDNTIFTGYTWEFETREQMLTKGIITGYVEARDGTLEDINLIWVSADNGQTHVETYLSMDGRYSFQNMDQGPWTITVMGGNYVTTSTTEFVTAGETTDVQTIYLIENPEPDEEASLMTICILTTLVIIVVITVIVILARKNTKDEEKRGEHKPPIKVPPYTQNGRSVPHTVIDGHKKEKDGMTPIGVGKELGTVPVEDPPFLLDEEDEDFELTSGPVVDHSLDEDDEFLEEHMGLSLEDDEIEIMEDEVDEEAVLEEMGGPTQNKMAGEGEPGSSSKPRMLEAPPGFQDD